MFPWFMAADSQSSARPSPPKRPSRTLLVTAGLAVVAAAAVAIVALATTRDARAPSAAGVVVPADPADVHSPVAAGEELPEGFFQVVPRDFIEPVYAPRFVGAGDAGWADDADVIGIAIGDQAKAYPVSLLNSSEMVIDEIDDVPIVVTWCPLCGTAMVHRRVVAGETVVFGVQGALFHNAMTWWDHDTGSIWSQPLGEAIAGPRTGARVELLPSAFTTWGAWRETHPDTLALDAPAAATGFDLAQLFIVVELGDEVRAYPVVDVRAVGVVNDVIAGTEVAVVTDPADLDRWAVFSRRLEGGVVELAAVGDRLQDRATGTVFDPALGGAIEGPLVGSALARLPAHVSFPGGGPTKVPIFDVFWPEGTVWRP